MPTPVEQELLNRVRNGDQAAMGSLLQQHQLRLYNVCLRMVSNRDDAAELTQDVMVKVVQNIDDYHGDAALSTWMIRIAMNHCISHLRKQKLRRTVSLDGSTNSGGQGDANDDQATALRHRIADQGEPSPLDRVENREQLHRLRQAIAAVDPDFRAVLVLRDIDEMDYQQIAQVLDLPVGTVKSRLFRARLALREQLVKMENQSPGQSAPRRVNHG